MSSAHECKTWRVLTPACRGPLLRPARPGAAGRGRPAEGWTMGARTGEQFLEGLRKTPRQLWLGDERIADVTEHPALAGAARTLAEVFDRPHRFADKCLIPDPQTAEPINISHMFPRSVDDLK